MQPSDIRHHLSPSSHRIIPVSHYRVMAPHYRIRHRTIAPSLVKPKTRSCEGVIVNYVAQSGFQNLKATEQCCN